MKLAVLALGLLTIVVLAACGPSGPSAGMVKDKDFTEAHEDYIAGFDMPGSCQMVGKVEQCTPGMHIPARSDYTPDRWSLYLDDGNKHRGWVDVSQDTYDRCHAGSWCDTKEQP